MTKLFILSKGTIHSDHQVLQKSYLGKKWTDVFLFSSRTSTLASWTLSWPFWSLFTGTGDFKKGFKFLKTKYRQTKMCRHVVLAMDVSVFLLKTIGIPQKFHKVVMTIGQIDPNIALIIWINDIFWILFDCKVNMCDWLTVPTSRDLSGTSDLHENIIFWIILHSHSCAITIFFYEAFEFCLYSILQILVGNIHSTKQYFKTYHQQKPVLIYLKSESCNINIR